MAGRCQLDRPNVKPAVDTARRVVVRPSDVGYVKRGDRAEGGAVPPVVALGKDGGTLFLRFAIAVPAKASIVEAYVVLRRSTLVDDDPAPISLHATRIVEAWSGGSLTWAMQPRTADARLATTRVDPGARSLVRLDVRELVRHWARRDANDEGIAITAENETRTGTTFALTGGGAERESVPTDVEPYLELYVR